MKITFTKVITLAIIGMVLSVQAAQIVVVANPSTGGSGGSGTVTGVTCTGASGVTCSSNGSSTAPVLSVGISGPVPTATYATNAGAASTVSVSGVTGLGAGVASAVQNAANAASGVVVLNGSSQYPAKDGSLITNLAASQVSGLVGTSRTITASASAVAADVGAILTVNSASAVNVTIDTDANIGWGANASILTYQAASGAVSIVAASGVTVDAGVGIPSAAVGRFLGALRVAANHWVMF